MKKSEIRKHYFLDKYVVISPKRAERPHETKVVKEEIHKKDDCFMCPDGKVDVIYEIKDDKGGWLVRSIKNIYPALSMDNKYAYGNQEIIIETPDHSKDIHELSIEQLKKILAIYEERTESLSKIKGICYVLVFKNEGGRAGESINHTHSQVIALPMVPPVIQDEVVAMETYIMNNHECPYCKVMKDEKKSPRVAWEDKNIFVLCPFASEFPYETWILPKRHLGSLHDMTESEKTSLAHALQYITKKLYLLDDLSYNYFFHNSLPENDHHMLLRVTPRPNIWAGLELGSGVIINAVPPEDAAKFYRLKVSKPNRLIIGR